MSQELPEQCMYERTPIILTLLDLNRSKFKVQLLLELVIHRTGRLYYLVGVITQVGRCCTLVKSHHSPPTIQTGEMSKELLEYVYNNKSKRPVLYQY